MNKFTMLLHFIAGLVFGYLMVILVTGDYPMHLPICLAVVWIFQMARIVYLARNVEQNVQSTIGSVSGRDVYPGSVGSKQI